VIEHDARPIGRPVEVADDEGAAGDLLRLARVEIEDVQVRHAMVLVDHRELPVLLVPFLDRVGLRLGGGIGDEPAVGRPDEPIHSVGCVGQQFRITAGDVDAVDLPLAGSVRHKREPLAVRRPRRLRARLLLARQLPRLPAGLANPDLRLVRIVLPVRLANRVRDARAVR